MSEEVTRSSGARRRGAPAADAPPLALRVGPFRVDGELGRGGMGVVYRAFDERLHRNVALKALPAELAADSVERARLESEARALALVNHPNVASIHGIEESGGTLYLVLELVEGESLRALIDREPLEVDRALELSAQVAAGLAAVHRKALVHRDLKPSNVMVSSDGIAKLLDFGLAKRVRGATRGGAPSDDEGIAGTSGFMSPEQLRGEPVDARCDIFAFGCLLHECLSGLPAFPGSTWRERDQATLHREPDGSRMPPATPPAVLDLLRECLAKDPGGRPGSMDDALRRLDHARQVSSQRRAEASVPRHSLPAERDTFVGRASELEELAALIEAGHRLVSVLGIGGTGKTRLALQLARSALPRFPGGAWFCDLSEARSVDGIVSAVASALDVALAKADPVAQIGHAIAGRGRCLIVLDNFEQVARHAEETLGAWLDRAGEATFVVTTREVLGLPGERALALAPLVSRDATALFVERARGTRSDFAPDASELAEIDRLVSLLDRLPLAIELAAARVRVMPPRVLLQRMTERFRLLSSSGARRTRQSTLKATFDWSWELLSPDERAALAQISVFEGGFTLEAAERVLSLAELWPADAVQALVDKSWVRPAPEGRFDVLVSVHEYAAQQLATDGTFPGSGPSAESAAQQRHGAHFAELGSDDALDALDRHGGLARFSALSRDLDNVVIACRRAIARGDAPIAAAACRAAHAVLGMSGPVSRASELVEATLRVPVLAPSARARLEFVAGRVAWTQGRSEPARQHYEAALALARGIGDRRLEGTALSYLATLHRDCGEMEMARERVEAALATLEASGDRAATLPPLGELANIEFELGLIDAAAARHETAIALAREVGDRRAEASTTANMGNAFEVVGRTEEARACYESALSIHREIGNRRSQGILTLNLGLMDARQGRAEQARALCGAALVIAREVADRGSEGFALSSLALIEDDVDRPDECLALHVAALAVHRETANRRGECVALLNIGDLQRRIGRHAEALDAIESALALTRALGSARLEGVVLSNLARLHLEVGRTDDARASLDDAERLLRMARDAAELGKVLCSRATLALRDGHIEDARTALAEAEALAAQVGAGHDSDLGLEIAALRGRIEGDPEGAATPELPPA